MITFILAVLLAMPLVTPSQEPGTASAQHAQETMSEEVAWCFVPLAAGEVEIPRSESWMIRNEYNGLIRAVGIEVEPIEGGGVVVHADNWCPEFHGYELFFQLHPSGDRTRRLAVRGGVTYSLYEGHDSNYYDLHGPVTVECDGSTVRLAYRLHATEVNVWGCEPLVLEGAIHFELEAAATLLTDLPAARGPDALSAANADLSRVWQKAPDGTPFARGRIDKDGYRYGAWTTWHPGGGIATLTHWKAGERIGRWTGISPDGITHNTGPLLEGLRHGHWTFVTNEGNTWSGRYERKHKQGEWTTRYPNGELKNRLHYLDGREHGPADWWWSNGVKAREGNFTNGKATGTWRHWNQDGTLDWERTHD